MKSISEDPKKKDPKKSDSKARSGPGKKTVYTDVGSRESKNYKEGHDNVNGPHWDVESRDVDGDTTVNAGVFK
jgi:hypothetical protein